MKKIEWEKELLTETYGKLIAGPFNPGFGVTIGNGLRRTLLSSIKGAAVTWVKIEGVTHEYASIPCVVEDVIDIILNIKGLAITLLDSTSQRISLKKEGKGEVTAANLQYPVGTMRIFNPTHHIATLTDGGNIEMEMEVTLGQGYVPAEMHVNNKGTLPVGIIFIDSFFSPIIKVNSQIENVRIGRMTNYERLTLEIWTNGTIHPKETLIQAAGILKDEYSSFISFEEDLLKPEREREREKEKEREEEEEEREEEEEIIIPKIIEKDYKKLKESLKMSIEELELSVRAFNCLQAAGINTLDILVQYTELELLKTRNFGKKSLSEIKEKLSNHNLMLGMKDIIDSLKQEDPEYYETPEIS